MKVKLKAFGSDGKWWFSDENLHFSTADKFKTVDMKNAPFAFKDLRSCIGFPDSNGSDIYENDVVAFYGKEDTEEMIELEKAHVKSTRALNLNSAKGIEAYNKEWSEFNEKYGKMYQEAPVVEQCRFLVNVDVFDLWLKNEHFELDGERLYRPEDCVVIGNIDENPNLMKGKQ